jgi:hypothetical protein
MLYSRYTSLAVLALLLSGCLSTPRQKIKRIAYYTVSGEADPAKVDEIVKGFQRPQKIELYDTLGNLIRENRFDKDGIEDNIEENTYDSNNKLIEKVTYTNYYKQPHTKHYLYRYIYQNGLLKETLFYFRNFDSVGFWAKDVVTYNAAKQKIKEAYCRQDSTEGETRLYDWKDRYSYVKTVLNKAHTVAERHFVQLNKDGKEVEHNMNFSPSAGNELAFPNVYQYTFDQYGNELTRVRLLNDKLVDKTEYEYRYKNGDWVYRCFRVNKAARWTELRKIDYY